MTHTHKRVVLGFFSLYLLSVCVSTLTLYNTQLIDQYIIQYVIMINKIFRVFS